MALTHEDIKNMQADHCEWWDAQEALRKAEAEAEALAEASLLDRFERDWGDF